MQPALLTVDANRHLLEENLRVATAVFRLKGKFIYPDVDRFPGAHCQHLSEFNIMFQIDDFGKYTQMPSALNYRGSVRVRESQTRSDRERQ